MAFGYVQDLISDEIPDPIVYYTDFVAEKNKERAAVVAEDTRPRAFCLLISKIKKYRQWQCLHCSSRPLTVLRILLSLSVAFFNFKRCLKQLIVLKYMLIQIRV